MYLKHSYGLSLGNYCCKLIDSFTSDERIREDIFVETKIKNDLKIPTTVSWI